MYIKISYKSSTKQIIHFLSHKTCKIHSKSINITDKLKIILDSARNLTSTDRFNDTSPLYLLKLQSTSLIHEINSLEHIDREIRSYKGKVSLALLHCYSNNGYLDSEFINLLLNNIYLKGCSPRAMLTILESLQKTNFFNDIIYKIFNELLGNQKTLVSLPPQDLSQLLWRFIAIHENFPFFTSDKYYYTIGTLIMHCRKRILYCLRNHGNKIAWSVVGANRALDDFLMAMKLFSHSGYCKGGLNLTYDDVNISDNLSKLYLSQLNAINELMKLPVNSNYQNTDTSDTAKKVIISLQDLLQSNEFDYIFNNAKIRYESPVLGTRYSIDIIITRN